MAWFSQENKLVSQYLFENLFCFFYYSENEAMTKHKTFEGVDSSLEIIFVWKIWLDLVEMPWNNKLISQY